MLWVAPPARWSALRSPEFRNVTGIANKIPGIRSMQEFDAKCAWIPKVLENGWTTTEPAGPFTPELNLHFGKAVDQVLLENVDPAEALSNAAKLINADIKQAKRSQ